MSIENIIKTAKGHFVSNVRRIEKVYPIKGDRTVALILCCSTGESHEDRMKALSLLKEQSVTATICITGDVAENDAEFVETALAGDCQIINGGFSGRPFSARKLNAPSSVFQLPNYDAALDDVTRLHKTMSSRYGYAMTAGMPPYGVESIATNLSAFDIYDLQDYQLYKGSFPVKKGDEQKLLSALSGNPESLNGQIVTMDFSVAEVLRDWFNTLAANDYGLCSVEALLQQSPFTDIGPDETCFEDACKLLQAGYPIACRNNCIYPKTCEIFGDTSMVLCGKENRVSRIERVLSGKTMMGRYSVANVYAAPIAWARNLQMRVKFDFPTTSALFGRVLLAAGYDVRFPKMRLQYSRRDVIKILADVLCATAEYDPYGVLQEHDTDFEAILRKEYGSEVFEELKAEVKAKRAEREASGEEAKGEKKKELSVRDIFGMGHRTETEEQEKTAEPVKKKDDQIEL